MTHMEQDSIKPIANAILGYGLIILGVFVMFLAFLQGYRVFSKQAQVPEIFHFEGVKVDMAKFAPQVNSSSALDAVQQQLKAAGVNVAIPTPPPQQDVAPKEIEMIPGDVLNASINIGFFIFFLGFVVNFGAKLADIGTKLVRPIYVTGTQTK